jgi:hypothetical protein
MNSKNKSTSNLSSNYLTDHEKKAIHCVNLIIAKPELWKNYNKKGIVSIDDILEKEKS